MIKKCRVHFILVICALLFFPQYFYPGGSDENNPRKLNKSSFELSKVKFNINNISTFIYNNGISDEKGYNSGFEFPKGSKKTAIFSSGFVWGAKINGEVRVGGSTFDSGLAPGKILSNGTVENPSSENVRVFRVRRDFREADLSMEAEDENKSVSEIYNQYDKDWNEWPVNNGAPFEDVDGNGIYNSTIDIPGVPGADQTMWYVANDLDSNLTKSFYGSLPLGVEMQVTIWGYDLSAPLGNTVFKKYTIINKSNNDFEDMYLGIWADPDLGDAGDDLVGCDTTLNLGYVYNGNSYDAAYKSLNPPAVGFCLLNGPVVDGLPDDKARFNGKILLGKKNLPMTGFSYIYKVGEPSQGDYNKGTIHMYNLLQGLLGDGTPYPLSVNMGSGSTKFPYSGDPVNNTGFVDGYISFPNGIKDMPSDHRLMVCSGPFNMAAGDTQEIVFMQIAAGADGETNYLSAVNLLKYYTKVVTTNYLTPEEKISATDKLNVKVSLLNRQAVLNWGDEQNQIDRVEKGDYVYKFQGYNVYQFPSANSKLDEGKLIATYDIIDGVKQIISSSYDPQKQTFIETILQHGSDSGIKRFFLIEKDYLQNQSLTIGEEYYFGVSYYSFNGEEKYVNTLENGLNIIKFIPQFLPAGLSFTKNYGDVITAYVKNGMENYVDISAFIIDPNALTGDEYEVTINKNNNVIYYSLKNITSNKTLFENNSNIRINFDNLITDGFILQVSVVPPSYFSGSHIAGFKTDRIIYNETSAKNEIDLINVFPNPYYAIKREYVDEYNRHVTFTHLPNHVIIRIFNLAGELVYKTEKNDDSKFYKWHLLNNNNFIVPGGLYIACLEMPESGKIKILKLAVIQGDLIPSSF